MKTNLFFLLKFKLFLVSIFLQLFALFVEDIYVNACMQMMCVSVL